MMGLTNSLTYKTSVWTSLLISGMEDNV
jgi:hypothetical protein